MVARVEDQITRRNVSVGGFDFKVQDLRQVGMYRNKEVTLTCFKDGRYVGHVSHIGGETKFTELATPVEPLALSDLCVAVTEFVSGLK